MVKLTLIPVLLAIFSQVSSAFVVAPGVGVARPSVHLFASGDPDSGGGAAIAKPKIKLDQKTETKQKSKTKQASKVRTFDPISRREEEFQEAPMFKLMLLGDTGYDSSHVIERLCAIVEDMDEDQASTVLQQANQSGKAMCGKYPFERGELFKEQLIRSNPMIMTDLEEA
jgi:ATP-dependent Clp protease adapter protein ClpS